MFVIENITSFIKKASYIIEKEKERKKLMVFTNS